MQICLLCGDSWKYSDRKRILSMGSCRGYNPWQTPPDLHKPWRCKPDVPIAYMGKVIHPSHTIKFHRGIVFCIRCGCRTAGKRVCHLTKACGQHITVAQKRLRDKMLQGKAPFAGGWPLPESARCPQPFVQHLWDDGCERAVANWYQIRA